MMTYELDNGQILINLLYSVYGLPRSTAMDKQFDDLLEDKVNAGRGVAKDKNPESDAILMENNMEDNDRPDDRARKAGY